MNYPVRLISNQQNKHVSGRKRNEIEISLKEQEKVEHPPTQISISTHDPIELLLLID